MKKSYAYVLAFLVIIVLLSGCGPKCPECPPSAYSQCDEKGVKTRTNYTCDESTKYICEGYIEEVQCKTEIKMKGEGVEAIITPSLEENVKGIVKIEVVSVPQETKMIASTITGPDIEPLEKTGPNIGIDTEGSDGWKIMFDTTKYKNGLYSITVIVFSTAELKEGNAPIGHVQGQIIIGN